MCVGLPYFFPPALQYLTSPAISLPGDRNISGAGMNHTAHACPCIKLSVIRQSLHIHEGMLDIKFAIDKIFDKIYGTVNAENTTVDNKIFMISAAPLAVRIKLIIAPTKFIITNHFFFCFGWYLNQVLFRNAGDSVG